MSGWEISKGGGGGGHNTDPEFTTGLPRGTLDPPYRTILPFTYFAQTILFLLSYPETKWLFGANRCAAATPILNWGWCRGKTKHKKSICPPFYLPGVIVKFSLTEWFGGFHCRATTCRAWRNFFPLVIFKLHSVCFNFYPFRVTEASTLAVYYKSCIMMLPLTTSAI